MTVYMPMSRERKAAQQMIYTIYTVTLSVSDSPFSQESRHHRDGRHDALQRARNSEDRMCVFRAHAPTCPTTNETISRVRKRARVTPPRLRDASTRALSRARALSHLQMCRPRHGCRRGCVQAARGLFMCDVTPLSEEGWGRRPLSHEP